MRAGATTAGERAAADAAAKRVKPQPKQTFTPLGDRCDHGVPLSEGCRVCAAYRPPSGQAARPAGRQAYASTDYFEYMARRQRMRAAGFAMPDDQGFEAEFTSRAADYNAKMAAAREAMDRNNKDYLRTLREHFANAKMTPEQRAQFDALINTGRARFYSEYDLARILGLERS